MQNNVVAAILSKNYHSSNRWVTLTSKSKRENLKLYTNFNSKLRFEESFAESSCDIVINKIQNDTRIKYKATVRNCAESKLLQSISLQIFATNRVISINYPPVTSALKRLF